MPAIRRAVCVTVRCLAAHYGSRVQSRIELAQDLFRLYAQAMPLPKLRIQEIPFDDPESNNMFRPTAEKPLLATPAAIEM